MEDHGLDHMNTHPSKARPDRRRWWRARRRGTLPLAVLTVVTALIGWSSPEQVEWPWLLSGLVIYLILLVVQVLRSPTASPVWSRGLLLLVCYLAFATTRHGAGAAASGFTPLSVLPVLGAGLYGRRRDVALALGGGVVALALPIALDPAAYPAATEERRTLLWLIANALVVITMHRLVSSHRRTIKHLDLLATTSRDLSTALDAREAICRVAAQVTDADVVYLLERESFTEHHPPQVGGRTGRVEHSCSATGSAGKDSPVVLQLAPPNPYRPTGQDDAWLPSEEGGWLVSTAVVGQVDGHPAPPCRIDLTIPSLTTEAFNGRQVGFIADVANEPGVSEQLRTALQVASAAWQAVGTTTERIGLLVVIYHRHRDELDPAMAAMVATLANDAAVAIERENLLAQTQQAATHDALTGLANRHRWDATATLEVAHARREDRPLTFALIDLDHFKRYNDTRGHLVGDQLLRDFARAAAASVRDVDTLARWGGEEFALALPGCTAQDALAIATRVHAAVPDGQSCTIGIAQWAPGQSHHDTLRAADGALYAAKDTRRGSTAVA